VFCTLQESAEETMKELGRFHNNEKVIICKRCMVLRKMASLSNIANIHMWFRDNLFTFERRIFLLMLSDMVT
jgi:hypothetical protein